MQIVIPIGDHPFFIKACIENIRECISKKYKITFITTNKTKRMENALFGNSELLEIKLPVKDGVHLELLDIFFNQSNSKWIYIQHPDLFWRDSNYWLDDFDLSNELACIFPSKKSYIGIFDYKEHKFSFKNKKLIRAHDFCGLYNVDFFKRNKLTFTRGKLKDLPLSDKLKSNIHNVKLTLNSEIDGSDLIGLELGINHPDRIVEVDFQNKFFHSWDLFTFTNHLENKGNCIKIHRPLKRCIRSLNLYSYVSSFLYNVEDKDIIFPRKIYLEIAKENKLDISQNTAFNILDRYKGSWNVLGHGTMGIERVEFEDYEFQFKKNKF